MVDLVRTAVVTGAASGIGRALARRLADMGHLVHLVDVSGASGRDPVEDFDTIQEELRRFNPEVAAKPQIVAANKIDALDDPDRLERLRAHLQPAGIPLYPVSAVTGEGLPLLLEAVWKKLLEHKASANEEHSRVEDR